MASNLFDVAKSKSQLQEVEAALASDPENKDLQNLREDLIQVRTK